MSSFEVVASGVAQNIDAIEALGPVNAAKFVRQKASDLWNEPWFQQNSGAGVRGTTRLARLLPEAKGYFKP
jgi:hypothetical protein